MAPRKKPALSSLTVTAGVKRDLAALKRRDAALATSGLAAAALSLAAEMDNKGNSATSRAMCSKALLDTLDRLRGLAPEAEQKGSKLDDLTTRRAARRAG